MVADNQRSTSRSLQDERRKFRPFFIPKLKPNFDFIRIDLEFYKLNYYNRFLAFVTKKFTKSARGECGVENYASVTVVEGGKPFF